MARWKLVAIDASGRRESAVREAPSRSECVAQLKAGGFSVISIVEEKGGTRGNGVLMFRRRMSLIDVEFGFRQLSSMLKSGVSLLSSLETVSEQSRTAVASKVWRDVADGVASGSPFSDSLARHPRDFDAVSIQLARVGEHSGELDTALLRAAEQIEARRGLARMVANAVGYPCFAMLMAFGVTAYLVAFVIPGISEFLKSGGARLPEMTQMLVDLSAWLNANGLFVLAGAVALFLAVALVRTTAPGRDAIDAFLLRAPVVGGILRISGTAVFSRAMKMLLESGVTLLDSLDVAKGLLRNSRLSGRVGDAYAGVSRGSSLAEALSGAVEFMPMLPKMTAVGEATGSLSESFGSVASYHEMLLAHKIKRLGAFLEPTLVIVTAGIVGFVYISFFLAMFSMSDMV